MNIAMRGPSHLSAVTEKSAEQSSHSGGLPMVLTPTQKSSSTANPDPDVTMSDEMRQMFAKLIDEKGNLDMRNVTSLIWANRRDPALIKAVTDQLIENSNEQTVFNGIEFYLPQLAHMVIHLEVELPTPALEQFALIICQQSLHVALQLNWILLAALQDYQPETPEGETNRHANAVYFARCAKLLQNVERVISLGSPAAAKLEELYYRGQLTKGDVERLAMQDRRTNAMKVLDGSPRVGLTAAGGSSGNVASSGASDRGGSRATLEGPLWHKRWFPRERPHRRQWIRRWFAVEDRVLYCYRSATGAREQGVKRAIVLNHADVEAHSYKSGKYPSYFEVTSPMGNMRLRADSMEDLEKWIRVLREEAQAPPVMHLHITSVGQTGNNPSHAENEGAAGNNGWGAAGRRGSEGVDTSAATLGYSPALDLLSPGRDRVQLAEQQRKRYEFFDGQRTFVRSLTDICEELRFIEDRSKRTVELEKRLVHLKIPEISYLPLCKSTDPFRRVLRVPPGEAKAFSTKARCPALVTFETAAQWTDGASQMKGQPAAAGAAKVLPQPPAGAAPLDVANYMYWTFCSSGDAQWHSMRGSMRALYGGEIDVGDLRLQQATERDEAGSPKGISRLTTMLSQKMSLPHIVLDRERDRDGSRDRDSARESARESREGTAANVSASGAGEAALGAASAAGSHQPPHRERHHHPITRPSVWRERSKQKAPDGGIKSPFPNLSSLSSGRFMRAPSFKGVSLSMPTFGKKPEEGDGGSAAGPGNSEGSVGQQHPPRRASWMRNMLAARDGAENPDATAGEKEPGAAEEKEKDSAEAEAGYTDVDDPVAEQMRSVGAEGRAEAKTSEKGPQAALDEKSGAEHHRIDSGALPIAADVALPPPKPYGNGAPPDFSGRGRPEAKAREGGGMNGDATPLAGPSPTGSLLAHPPLPPPANSETNAGNGLLATAGAAGAVSRGTRAETGNSSVWTGDEEEKSEDCASSEDGDDDEAKRANEAVSYGETYSSRIDRLRRESPLGGTPGWGLERLICKSNDDLRQEVFVMQLISFYAEVFEKEKLQLWLKPYRILSTGKTTGMIEVLNNSISLDGLKKSTGYAGSMRAHFEKLYGPPGSPGQLAAQKRFAASLAGYSVICYLLRIKDRHNGNIMLTARGRVIHIDFGFVMGLAPGNDFSFERAPFKLTLEYVEALGGIGSAAYKDFCRLFCEGLQAARKYATPACTLIEIMMFQSEFPCFAKFGKVALTKFRQRLLPDVPDSDIPRRAQAMVDRSYNHRGTRIYDEFQLATNKIRP